MLQALFPRLRDSVCFKLPCPLFPCRGVSFPVVPGLKALQSKRRSEIGETAPARYRRLLLQVPSSAYSRRALRWRTLGPRTYSSLSRENLSNKLGPSGSCVAGAAILPYARWFTEVCGWGDVRRHRAWARTRAQDGAAGPGRGLQSGNNIPAPVYSGFDLYGVFDGRKFVFLICVCVCYF